MVYAQPSICPRQWDTQTSMGFWHTNGSSNLIIINKKEKKRTCKIVDFTVPADNRVKLKENEKKDIRIPWPCSGIEKNWNMKMTSMPIVLGTLGTVTEGLLKRLEDLKIRGLVKTIQTILSRLARILRRVQETWGDLLSLKLKWKTIS